MKGDDHDQHEDSDDNATQAMVSFDTCYIYCTGTETETETMDTDDEFLLLSFSVPLSHGVLFADSGYTLGHEHKLLGCIARPFWYGDWPLRCQ